MAKIAKKHKLIRVEWEDSASLHGWRDEEDRNAGICTIESIGYLIDETKTAIAIAQSKSLNATFKPYGDILNIPKSAIRKRKYFK